MIVIFIIWIIPSLLLALPTLKRKPVMLAAYLVAVLLSFVIWVLPVTTFLLSGLLTPEWKGDCPHGWLDCFHVGKLALTPLVLWAAGALYSVEVLRREDRARPGIILGLFSGALISMPCLILGLFTGRDVSAQGSLFLLVPAYAFIWSLIRAMQLLRQCRPSWGAWLATITSHMSMWYLAALWAQKTFRDLPDQHPSHCFVVTAAGRGHQGVVGPFTELTRHGQSRLVNNQLLVFWELERFWQSRAPRSRAWFRNYYNRLGPIIAGHIRSPWTADMVYIALKPLEWCATVALKLSRSSFPEPSQPKPQPRS